VGAAVATPGFRLPARWIIHTVGPNLHAGQTDPELLASCFRESLGVAAGLGAESVAFPAISAGVYGWDPSDVASIAVDAVLEFDAGSAAGGVAAGLELVEFVLFNSSTAEVFRRAAGG
jgi:O-acetyl-ADP-ribose deacetylase (regulator of RNase III)